MSTSNLAALGERAIIAQFIRPLLSTEYGNILLDDCAVVDIGAPTPLLLSTDQGPRRSFIELLGVGTPSDLAHFHVTINVSDIAAMGGRPVGMLLVLALKASDSTEYLSQYLHGLKQAMSDYGVCLFGGDTKQADTRSTTITIVGLASDRGVLRREGARQDDVVFMSGPPLGSALRSFIRSARYPTNESISRPMAQVSFGQSLVASGVCTSCMDMSDGLLASAEQLGDTSNVTFHIDFSKVPMAPSPSPNRIAQWQDLVTNVGGDFGLLFTTSPEGASIAEGMGAVRIGNVGKREGRGISDADLECSGVTLRSWEQFKTVEKISDDLLSFVAES